MWANLHRHGENSKFDGFGKAKAAAKLAASFGQTALGLTDHGDVSGLVSHYYACKEAGIKPILGVEAYFQPRFNPDKQSFHLCIFATSKEGYSNMMRIMTKANRESFYRRPIVTFDYLEEFGKDIIVTSACIGGHIPQMIVKGRDDLAVRSIERFKDILGNRFYIEIMPYEIDDKHTQRDLNERLMSLAKKHGVMQIITTDSHYGAQEDFDTYTIMHQIAGHGEFAAQYQHRYMPSQNDVTQRFREMHPKYNPQALHASIQDLVDQCNVEDLRYNETVPKFDWGMPAKDMLKKLTIQGLKETGRWTQEYRDRAKMELHVITQDLGFEDYFLLCYDIILNARKRGVPVGPGRGSVCGSLVANAIGITQVDPLVLDTDFERFLRPDKKKLPDIDMDFGQDKRHLVIEYIMEKHKGRAAQIGTKGFFRANNLGNDLAKVYELEETESTEFKKLIEGVTRDTGGMGSSKSLITYEQLMADKRLARMERTHRGLVKHFSKLYGQMRFTGKHAAGIAITAGPIEDYLTVVRNGNGYQTCYDMDDLNALNVLKIDILGLATCSILDKAAKLAKVDLDYGTFDDEAVYQDFRDGLTDGVFQFEKPTAKEIVVKIQPTGMQDILAASALNRPAPIQLGMTDIFVGNKNDRYKLKEAKKQKWYPYTTDTYGTIIYQEHVMRICRNLAGLEWPIVEKILKALNIAEDAALYRKMFIDGCVKVSKMSPKDADELYARITCYSFNKGHSSAYALISYQAMWLKHYYPLQFWCAMLQYEADESKLAVYKSCCVRSGNPILLPHVNGPANYKIVKVDGGKCIQTGIGNIKNVGPKAAEVIVANQPYIDFPDFEERVPKRSVNARVIAALKDAGAFEFSEKNLLNRNKAYNATLHARYTRVY